MSILALDKWFRFIKIINQHGGPFKALKKLWWMDTLKEGKLMGRDTFGNAYYENQNYMMARSRWVEYNPLVKWDYDASQVCPEWYGWLHYKTDQVPTMDWAKFCLFSCCWSRVWLQPHCENVSGTMCAYYPYDTTRAKVQVWDGLSITNRCSA